ncbi:lysosome-associated membrane glycoprotein 5 [Heteronotia binoei]|uniref:lysosome-associated membrane glycoprotein 5 n=1 Tax=Heteronotia binoei TaxID=13085 RepID=UPI00292E8D94|nr:lysosome-associated membrane glycoprotein 5 [Heteronotia binoei]
MARRGRAEVGGGGRRGSRLRRAAAVPPGRAAVRSSDGCRGWTAPERPGWLQRRQFSAGTRRTAPSPAPPRPARLQREGRAARGLGDRAQRRRQRQQRSERRRGQQDGRAAGSSLLSGNLLGGGGGGEGGEGGMGRLLLLPPPPGRRARVPAGLLLLLGERCLPRTGLSAQPPLPLFGAAGEPLAARAAGGSGPWRGWPGGRAGRRGKPSAPCPAQPSGVVLLLPAGAALSGGGAAAQEVENLSGLSPNPEKVIFAVRQNETTCLMAEFAARFLVPYDVWASNFVDLITEQASIPLSRGAEEQGRCGANESELQISWAQRAFSLRLSFVKEGRNSSRGAEAWWKMNRVQFIYDSSERTYFKDPVNPGKHTATTRHLSALVTPAGKSYECQAQQTITMTSSDHQKPVVLLLSELRLQPFDISSDFEYGEEHKCPVDQREQLEETLPLVLGLILGLIIVITLGVYHVHLKMTATSQVPIPRDRSEYKHMG